ncbi:MAG: hypothetical protein CL666_04640 [Balneola sp.]|nr:hypothetical protein [Balneola sp.]
MRSVESGPEELELIYAEEIKVLRKTRTELEEVTRRGNVIGFIPINQTETGVRVVRLSDMKIKGLYDVCRGLINQGRLHKYTANGHLKESTTNSPVFIDYDEFNQLKD